MRITKISLKNMRQHRDTVVVYPPGELTLLMGENDAGKTTITRYWKAGTYTVPALQEVESTEGGFIREGKNGKIIFDNRHHRLSGVGLTSQATYSDASDAARVYSGLIMDDPLPHIFNIFESDVQTYTTASVAVLWTLSETGASSPSIAPGVARTYIAR